MDKYRLSAEQVDKIKEILEHGHRVELIPVKNSIKVIQEVREEVKLNTERIPKR